ncbi:hypothetical protein GCM10023093_01330 [Nemorincola caseinilytica]|uniref:Secretion system C-terminal sorting domain-containing protein n=1 Tax=Nemorincola caseinilytica TaxID=2054315 RepID=A0ABP8N487_9BACT
MDIRVDSIGGVEVTKFVSGMTYTVTVTGSHATNTNYGFQYTAVTGSGASQTPAGTHSGVMPSQVAKRTFDGLTIIEQTSAIAGTGTPNTFSKTFTWTAPTVTGSPIDVKMYLTVNAVNNNNNADVGDASANMSITLQQHPTPSAVGTVSNGISVKAYPNPVTDLLNIQANAYDTYTIQVYDVAGRLVNAGSNNIITGSSTINTASWAPGMYNVVVAGENGAKTIQVIKQ